MLAKIRLISVVVLSLLILNMVSGSQMQDTTTLPYPPRPVWSPDGQHIVYMGDGGTYVMDRDGQNTRLITPQYVFESWTQDSQTLIFNGGYVGDQNQLWFYPIDGSEPQPAFQDFFMIWHYTYSPDGKYIALYAQKAQDELFELWLVEVTNGFPSADPVLLADKLLRDYIIFDIKWTKSGDELILRANPQDDTDQTFHIYLPLHQPAANLKIVPLDMEDTFYLDGGWELGFDAEKSSPSLIYVINAVRQSDHEVNFPLNRVMMGYGITQSPDEQTLLYAHFCDPEDVLTSISKDTNEASNHTALSSFDLITGTETTIFPCEKAGVMVHTSFSPDGSSILFDVTDEETGWHIYRADLEAGTLTNLIDITPAN